LTPRLRSVMPMPTTDPVTQWVVERGRLSLEPMTTMRAGPSSAANPREAVILATLTPSVRMMM